MTEQTKIQLRHARRLLERCATKISSRKTNTNPLSNAEREMLIGFGNAQDCIRWAVSLRDLRFQRREERSPRKPGITELVRFNLMWTATNALFAKESILGLIPAFQSMTNGQKNKITRSEFEQFEQIYKFASVDQALENACLTTLCNILSMQCKAEGFEGVFESTYKETKRAYPMPRPKPLPTYWEIIFHKYLRRADRTRRLGKLITTALKSKTPPVVDGPTLIYASRNWAVHGVLLTTFLRGSRYKFITYINNITLLLSAVVRGSADHFSGLL